MDADPASSRTDVGAARVSAVRRAATSAAYAHAAAVAESYADAYGSGAEATAVRAVAGRLRRLAVLTAQGATAEGYTAPLEADDA